jgi:ribosome-associated toxin RatA of RatAB toxin-antitoxin module
MPHIETEAFIPAPLDQVYAIAKDIERFHEFVPDVKNVTIVEQIPGGHISDWTGLVPKFNRTLKWREEDLWDDAAHTCRFRALSGDWRQYEGVWSFEAVEGGTRTHMALDCEVDVPMIGALIKGVIAKLTRENIDSILNGIRRRAIGEA